MKLLDLEFPASLAEQYPGPAFGVDGTRRLTNVFGRPIIGTIVKPSVGLTPAQTAALVTTLGEAGVDFIKDDELMANPPHSPFDERVAQVMRAVNELAARTGRKLMYAFNISDQLDRMREHHDTVLEAGGTCVMVSLNSVGYAGVEYLSRRFSLPIHGHRNGWGMYYRHPALGMEFTAYQKLWRLAGVDQLHVNGIKNKFCESDDSVVRSIHACLKPMLGGNRLMPVVSSGQWGGQAEETYRRTGTLDLMYLAGGGILAHPSGPAAGVTAIRQAWEAASNGTPLAEYAREHSELRESLAFFGKMSHSGKP
jgi:ribulose-bisphosphate carboxylase large chain